MFGFTKQKAASIPFTPLSGGILGSIKQVSMFSRKRKQKVQQTATLLNVLSKDPNDYRLISDLAEASGLGQTVYPLLADLKHQGLVEHSWANSVVGQKLSYRLTPAGLEHVRRGSV